MSGNTMLAQVAFVNVVIREQNTMSLSPTPGGVLDFDDRLSTGPYSPVALEGVSVDKGHKTFF